MIVRRLQGKKAKQQRNCKCQATQQNLRTDKGLNQNRKQQSNSVGSGGYNLSSAYFLTVDQQNRCSI